MKYEGKIKKLEHIVVSDPSYAKTVWCRYEREGLNERDWYVDIDIQTAISEDSDDEDESIEFYILLSRNNKESQLKEKGEVEYKDGLSINEVNIGMDTACVAIGINERASEIIASQKEWQPNCSLITTSDGIFGNVLEGVDNENKINFIIISGYLEEDADYTEEDVLEYLQEQLQIIDLKQKAE